MKPQTSALGATGRRVETGVSKKYRRRLKLLEQTVQLALDTLTSSKVYPGEKQKIVCAALFSRLIRGVEAGALLVLRGLEHDAIVSIRVNLELLSYLKLCSESQDFVKKYLLSNVVRRLKLVRGALKLSTLTAEKKAEYTKLEGELDQLVKKWGAEPLKFEQVFDEAKMSDHYNTIYRLTSHAVHSGPRVLDDLAVQENGVVVELELGPQTRKAAIHLFTLTEFLVDGCHHYSALAGVDIAKKEARIRRELQKNQPQWV